MADVLFWKEAEKDYRKLDGSMKQWADAAVDRLEKRGSEIGKPLHNNAYSKLAGFKELKNDRIGIRLIFKPSFEGLIEIVEIWRSEPGKKRKFSKRLRKEETQENR